TSVILTDIRRGFAADARHGLDHGKISRERFTRLIGIDQHDDAIRHETLVQDAQQLVGFRRAAIAYEDDLFWLGQAELERHEHLGHRRRNRYHARREGAKALLR